MATGQGHLYSVRGGNLSGGAADSYRVLNVPRAAIYRSTAQSIPNSSATVVTWDTSDYDSDNIWSAASPTRLTCGTPGLYLATASVTWALAGGSTRQLIIRKTTTAGAVITGPQSIVPPDGLLPTGIMIPWPVTLGRGDYLEVLVGQISGGALNIVGVTATTDRQNSFTLTLISTLG